MTQKLFQVLASLIQARKNCEQSGNSEWFQKHGAKIEHLVLEYMPSGAGFDNGTAINFEDSSTGSEKLVFDTSYHHMQSESGMYDGWTDHQVIVTPSLASGFNIRVTGRDRNETKGYISEVFNDALSREVQS